MKRLRPFAAILALGAIALAAGCGGGSSSSGTSSQDVPANAVAVVAGTPILRTSFDRFFSQAEKSYAAQGQTFPKAGTPEYLTLQNKAVDLLVERVEFQKEAGTLGIKVTDQEVAQKLDQLKQQYFKGDDAKYQAELKKEGLTETDIRTDLSANILAQKIYDQVTKGKTVTDKQVQDYYNTHRSQYAQPESRDVAHILVASKALADKLYNELQGGADFATLAKKYSTDTQSAKNGGELTDNKGSFVPEFEQVAFALKTGEVGKPVKSRFGWHVIKALGDTTPASTRSFSEVQDQIRQQLLTDEKNKTMSAWVNGIRAKYNVAYGVGFSPLPASTGSTGAVGTTGP